MAEAWKGVWLSMSLRHSIEKSYGIWVSLFLMSVCVIRRGSRILVRGAQQSLDPRGALSSKFAQNIWGVFIASKLHDFEKKILGKMGAGPPGPLDPLVVILAQQGGVTSILGSIWLLQSLQSCQVLDFTQGDFSLFVFHPAAIQWCGTYGCCPGVCHWPSCAEICQVKKCLPLNSKK